MLEWKFELNVNGIIEEIADPGTLLPLKLTRYAKRSTQ